MATQTRKNTNAETSSPEVSASNLFTLLKETKATKLSPKNPGELTYQIAKRPGSEKLVIRVISNDSGGYFSKEWIDVEAMGKVLAEQEKDKPLKSGVFKYLFSGGSSNNAGFCAAVCRAEGLLKPAPDSAFLHLPDQPFTNWLKEISKLKPIGKAEELTRSKAKPEKPESDSVEPSTDSSPQGAKKPSIFDQTDNKG